jgi:hypothetical protein
MNRLSEMHLRFTFNAFPYNDESESIYTRSKNLHWLLKHEKDLEDSEAFRNYRDAFFGSKYFGSLLASQEINIQQLKDKNSLVTYEVVINFNPEVSLELRQYFVVVCDTFIHLSYWEVETFDFEHTSLGFNLSMENLARLAYIYREFRETYGEKIITSTFLISVLVTYDVGDLAYIGFDI